MGWLFGLLAVAAALIFLAQPFWVAVAYLVVLGWSGFMLHVIFNQPDAISRAADELAE